MERRTLVSQIQENFTVHPAVVMLGPRQVGKTFLAHMFAQAQGAGMHLNTQTRHG